MDMEKLIGLKPDNIPQIQLVPIETLIPYHRNARTHSPAQVAQLEALLLSFGWTNAILVDDMGTVAGHGRTMAAENIYKRGEQIKFPNGTPIPIGYVPVIDCTGWSPEQRKAYIIADNASALQAGWNLELLALEVRELEAAEFDLDLTALDDDLLADLLVETPEPAGDADPDATPELPADPFSKAGDVWQLGPHRLAVGDSTDPETWAILMQGERADICLVDPPYGVDLERKNRLLDETLGGERNATKPIQNDKMTETEFSEFMKKAYACLFGEMKAGATIYVFHSDKFANVFRNEFEAAGFKFSQTLIWRKNNVVLGPARYLPIHEPVLVGRRPGGKSSWYGGRKQKTVIDLGEGSPFKQLEDGRWQIRIGDDVMIVSGDAMVEQHPSSVLYEAKPAKAGLHQSQKPVALCERLLANSARRGDIVIDGFGGSGTTLIAADRQGLYARLVECDPAHADTICRRYWQYTGRRPVHAITGAEFPADGEERPAPPPPAMDQPDGDIF